jgi:hypothetical protein
LAGHTVDQIRDRRFSECPTKDKHLKKLVTRHWGRATVKLPNGNPLIVHLAHL